MERVTREKQLTVITANKVGMFAEIAGLVAGKGLNIENICAYASGDKAVFYLLTDNNARAREALAGRGFQIEETDVLLLRLWNRPGSLATVGAKLKQHGISVEYVYGTTSKGGERMTAVFSSEDNDRAAEVFAAALIEEG